MRDALAQFLLEKKSDTFMAEIQVRETPELIGSPVTILDIPLPSTCIPLLHLYCFISSLEAERFSDQPPGPGRVQTGHLPLQIT